MLFLLILSLGLRILVFIRLSYLSWIRSVETSSLLFPVSNKSCIFFVSLFLGLRILNLTSIVIYRYPVTTTLRFNLRAALSSWVSGVILQSIKSEVFSAILPQNSPWYLVPFLCLVEVVSILVRPITLCFRLLANMVAGHVLITLICKIEVVWALGSVFGVLELAVAIVQAFVFSILISVYFEEAISH